jgi:hypothetical protein
VRDFRRRHSDAYNFNWLLRIPSTCSSPSSRRMSVWRRSSCGATPRRTCSRLSCVRAFSGIVAGNVKDQGVRLIEQYGPFELHGDPELLRPLDGLLGSVRPRPGA